MAFGFSIRQSGDALETVARIRSAIQGPTKVKVGFPSGKTDSEILKRAIFNEFGTSRGIPERSFVRSTARERAAQYSDLMSSVARPILMGEITFRNALEKLGIQVQGDIQMKITSLRSPPNSPATIERKGSSNPLIDSGQMRKSVTWEVVDA